MGQVVTYGKRLEINLSVGVTREGNIDSEFSSTFIGGMGFSYKILYDEVGPEVDPMGSDNLLIIANG